MENNNKQESTEEVNYKTRTSFSWDRAFFTSDGLIAAEELLSMIEGGEDGIKHELLKIEELENMEAILFQEFEASTQKTNLTNSQAKRVTGADGPDGIKTPQRRSSPVSGGSPGNNAKSPTTRSTSSKTGKGNADSPSKTPPRITTKSKEGSVNTRISRTSPASPVSPGSSGSSSSTLTVNQRSKRSGSAPSRSTTDARRNDDLKSSKSAVSLMPKTQSSISLKIKPTPVLSHRSSPSRQTNSPSSSTTQRTSESSSPSRGIKGSPVHHTSKPTLKNHHSGQISPNGKKPETITVAAANAGLKPKSPKTTSPKKQSRVTANILVISPELLDLQSKINALKLEINMHKKDRCNKMARAEGALKAPFAVEQCSR